MIEVKTGTMEEKILRILQEHYPVTVEELSKKLHISRATTEFELVKLQSKGIVALEPLPGRTFIRLLRNDFRFIGRKYQEKFIKRKRRKMQVGKEENKDDVMFG
ncbi:MAG: HTH domain-containing protein [Candidatus Thermoplasmatota archaeon]|nr:HTH domain-containing protein [Candidatus Thermoplasmatota archaeon]